MAYIDDVLTSIGASVTVGNTKIQGAFATGPLGADANELDATPLDSYVELKKPGLVGAPLWDLQYYLNEDDYDALEALKTAGTSVSIEVKIGNLKYTNTGICAANYPDGLAVNGMAQAKAQFALGSSTGWVKSTVSGN